MIKKIPSRPHPYHYWRLSPSATQATPPYWSAFTHPRLRRILGQLFIRTQSPIGHPAKQTWRMTRILAVEQPGEIAADSSPAVNDFTMDLVAVVQKELTSEEKCIKISFSSCNMVSLLVLLQRSAFSWEINIRLAALVCT